MFSNNLKQLPLLKYNFNEPTIKIGILNLDSTSEIQNSCILINRNLIQLPIDNKYLESKRKKQPHSEIKDYDDFYFKYIEAQKDQLPILMNRKRIPLLTCNLLPTTYRIDESLKLNQLSAMTAPLATFNEMYLIFNNFLNILTFNEYNFRLLEEIVRAMDMQPCNSATNLYFDLIFDKDVDLNQIENLQKIITNFAKPIDVTFLIRISETLPNLNLILTNGDQSDLYVNNLQFPVAVFEVRNVNNVEFKDFINIPDL